MIDLFRELDFSKEVDENLELKVFIHEACKKVEQEESENLRKIKKPELDDELLNQFVISGIPLLKTENEEKFMNLFKNKLLESKNIGEKNGLVSVLAGMENGVGNQTLYMTYKTVAEAKVAFNRLNNLKFDKNHTLQCIQIGELRGIIEEGEQLPNAKFEVPTFSTVAQKVEPNRDEQFRDQFLVRQTNFVYLNWLDHLDKSAKSALPTEYMPFNVQINKIAFSPRGSYMAVCCTDGIRIYYGGSNLKLKGFLKQYNPIDAKFSVDQRFIVTFNGNQTKNRENLILWAVEQEVKIKSYRAHSHQNIQSFQFSDDGQNLAVLTLNEVTFFTLASVQELIKQARAPQEQQHIVKAAHVQKVAWLKSKNWIIIMCYELDYSPSTIPATRIFLYNVEQKVQKKWRAWGEHAKNGQIFVSERGDWVAIALRKFIKKGHFATSVQIGNLLKREQGLQISGLQFKEDVGNISFDSYNNRLAVIYRDQSLKSINLRFNVSFFEIATKSRSLQINKIGQLTNNLTNRVALASNGTFFALYNISDDSAQRGRFSFGMITRENKEKGKKVFNFEFTKQNLMVNGMNFFSVEPSGRFALLATEKGYQIWNLIGEIVTKDTLQKNIHDVQWRPRIFNKLTEEEERRLLEQQKEIRKKYELIDDKRINSLKYEKQAAKVKQKELFLGFIAKKKSWFKNFADLREKMLGFKQFQARTDKYEIVEGFIDLQ